MRIARVIVDIPARALTEPFDYRVPEVLEEAAEIGVPVLVPFGPRSAVGYIVERRDESDREGLRELAGVLGPPLFRPWGYALASWIASEYVSTLADAMRLVLPPGGSPRLETVYSVIGERPAPAVRAEVWDAAAVPGGATASTLRRLGPSAPRTASTLAASGVLSREYRLLPPKAGEASDLWVERVPGSEYEPRAHARVQHAVLEALSAGPLSLAEMSAAMGAVRGAVKKLEAVGAVRVYSKRRLRGDGIAPRSAPRHEKLTDGQLGALRAIDAAPKGSTLLIDGVTGSGKTEVYLRAIEGVVARGESAIVLVPEISLTPQTVGRFRSRFGDLVAVLHSRLSSGERYDQWDLARMGEARVVVGPRSALFAPLKDLSLVVIDEEHDGSYKQGSAPRYHAREAARRLCAETGAVLVLGSATPSLESRISCENGLSALARMPARVAQSELPPVHVVDMAVEFSEGHRSMFSRPLLDRLQHVRERRQKAVVLLNRRGFASFVLCRDCGHVPSCGDCSVSLTYHEVGARLVCHHCGSSQPMPSACPACGSLFLRQFGAGTQRVEAELEAILPEWPVVRMDGDTTAGKGGHERQLARFEALSSGVLLGTQMIAKGLDYPDVTLVGVINADTTLHMPDFRAGERTYQLLEQVAGRTGRGAAGGEVVIQTYWPDNAAIQAAARHEPDLLYDEERQARASLGYPPFSRLANVTFSGRDVDAVRRSCSLLAEHMRKSCPSSWQLLGPSPAVLARVRGAFRWHVLVKAPQTDDISRFVREALSKCRPEQGVNVAPDIDPIDLM